MDDIVPALLAAVEKRYKDGMTQDRELAAIRKKIDDETATYIDADNYAKRTGDILASAYELISDDALPGGVMYYNVADRILRPTIEAAQKEVLDIAEKIQSALNKKAGIGIKAIRPTPNPDRIEGIIEKIVRGEQDEA